MKFAETNRLCRKKFKRLTGMSRRTFYLIVNIIKEYEKKKNKLGRPCRLIPEDQVLIADRGTSKLKSLCSIKYRHRLQKKISHIYHI
jgi:hypothetical protein